MDNKNLKKVYIYLILGFLNIVSCESHNVQNQDIVTKKKVVLSKEFHKKDDLKLNYKSCELNKNNFLFINKVIFYPEKITLSNKKLVIKNEVGDDLIFTNQILDSILKTINCQFSFEAEILPLDSDNIEYPDYKIKNVCNNKSSLILKSKARRIRGGLNFVCIESKSKKIIYNIKTEDFNGISLLVQLTDNHVLFICDEGLKYNESKYSFKIGVFELKTI